MPPWRKTIGPFLLELAKIVVVAFAIIVPVRYFILQPFYVKGASMEPNFHDNQYLIIDELSYRLHDPRRGDVIVLRNPNLPSEFFIKRIIGLPGEEISISDGHIRVTDPQTGQGGWLDESAYLASTVTTFGNTTVVLGTKEYFVMGDNRPASLDSRSFGPISRREIIGRTALRAWPFDKITTFSTPTVPYVKDVL